MTTTKQQPGPPADRLQRLLEGLTAVRNGDFSTRLPAAGDALMDEIAGVFNEMNDQLALVTSEVTRVATEVGSEGRLGGQAQVPGLAGTWKDLTDSVNSMAGNLTGQVRDVARVATAVARGDLGQKITVDVRGEMLELKNTINTMVDELSAFADEVTRVAREVGTEGRLGGQARVPGVGGTWRDLTDSVNFMAGNLTTQVRAIAQVATAVAKGDLGQKISVDARGEVLELKETINTMVGQLSLFADEVTRVAREVGTEGNLGGQAAVRGASGTWEDLTDNVNVMASNLTAQVRSIAQVTTAVARGDLSQKITVKARGEVAALADAINGMVESLRETTRAYQEQDWLQSNLARMARQMQGHRDLRVVAELLMNDLIPLVGAQHGTFFLAETSGGDTRLRLIAGYGLRADIEAPSQFRLGQSLIGQVAKTKKPIVVIDLPADYVKISSGLGEAAPVNLMVLPIVFEGQVLGVIEAGSFSRFTQVHQDFLEQLMETIGVNVNAIIAYSRTDALLTESQRLAVELQARTGELQARQEELQRSNVSKSQFLANMSHELRTPLNSLLILARLLAQNPEQNLTPKQVEYAQVIHSSGTDLLQLINDILDLSRVEAGRVELHPERFALHALLDDLRAVFRPLTTEKGLDFVAGPPPADVPAELLTDRQRLRQILHNLLSNAVKFTEHGRVELTISRAGQRAGVAEPAVAFAVADTGIGINEQNLEAVFGAFQQGDGTTSRRYGGTGLGLAICRELAAQLGGRIAAASVPGRGSTFTLYLPVRHTAEAVPSAGQPAVEVAPAGEVVAGGHAGLRGRKVLIVDDDVRNAFAISSILELYGMTVMHAPDGRAGIETLRRHRDIDIVLMDVMMPEMDGYATTGAIREIPELEALPVIAVTARAMHGDREKSIAARANDHVTKPVDSEELLGCMERWIDSPSSLG